jgi:hypothetical protein
VIVNVPLIAHMSPGQSDCLAGGVARPPSEVAPLPHKLVSMLRGTGLDEREGSLVGLSRTLLEAEDESDSVKHAHSLLRRRMRRSATCRH